MHARDGKWLTIAGLVLVLVRQKPRSAKGVMFITIEAETGVANLVIWRRVILAAGMIAVQGRIQRPWSPFASLPPDVDVPLLFVGSHAGGIRGFGGRACRRPRGPRASGAALSVCK